MSLFQDDAEKEHFKLLLKDTVREGIKEYHAEHQKVHEAHEKVHTDEIRPTLRELKQFKVEVRTAGTVFLALITGLWAVVKGWFTTMPTGMPK